METPSKPLRKVSYRSLEARREWRAEAALAARRRELAKRYPDVDPRAWANLGGSGYTIDTAGGRAVKDYLASVLALLGKV